MNFLSLFGGGGGGSGQTATSSARSAASAGSPGGGNVGVTSQDVVWIAVAFAAALAIFGLLWVAVKK